ncbi:MAG: hypothetical protein ACRDZ7_15575 [Acidimicrobiia bacterium]
MGVWRLALASSLALVAVALVFFWRSKATEGSATIKLPMGVVLEKASHALMVFAAGVGGSAYSIVQLASPPTTDEAQFGAIASVEPAPEPPGGSTKEELDQWLDEFKRRAVFQVDLGTNDEVSEGDYFVTIPDPTRVRGLLKRDVGKLNAVATALLRVDSAFPAESTARLERFEQPFLRGVAEAAEAAAGGAPIAVAIPVEKGTTVVRVPGNEKQQLESINKRVTEAVDLSLSEAKRFTYAHIVRDINDFEEKSGGGYFAPDTALLKATAQYALEQFQEAADTLKVFDNKYSQHVQAEAAQNLRKASQEAAKLKQGKPSEPSSTTTATGTTGSEPTPDPPASTTTTTEPPKPTPRTPTRDELVASLLRRDDLDDTWTDLFSSEDESVRGCGRALPTQPAVQAGVVFHQNLENVDSFLASQNYGYGGGSARAALDELKERYRDCGPYLDRVKHGNAPARVTVKQVVAEADRLDLYLAYSDPDAPENVILEGYESWTIVNHSIARLLYYSPTVYDVDATALKELLTTVAGRLRAIPAVS